MLYLSYTYHLYNLDHIRTIRQAITAHLVDHPLFIFPMVQQVQLRFDTNETAYYVEEQIANAFPDYEFIEDITDGGEDLLLSITKVQSPSSGDDSGNRWNEDALISQKHLVKKRERAAQLIPETTFFVFFGEEKREYKVHLGVYDQGKPEESFVVLEGPFDADNRPKPISDAIQNKADAIWQGIRLMEPKIEKEFAEYESLRKKKRSRKKKDK
jgi:hypothetical protein